ncbi:MAG: helix-turn-helix domain-containing protein [Bacillaceae bacterium]
MSLGQRKDVELYLYEQLLKEVMKEGDKEKIGEITTIIYTLEKPMLALHSLRSLKNYYIRLCCILEDSLVLTGFPINKLHEITRKCILEIEEMDAVEILSRYYNKMVMEYISLIGEKKEYKHLTTIERAINYIHSNVHIRFTLEEIAAHLNITTVYLSSLFKKELSVNFVDYVNECKIEASLKYIRFTDETISNISQQFGYCNQSHYSAIFKKKMNETPIQYRKRFRKSEKFVE